MALFCGLVLPSKMETRCFPHRTAHLSVPLPPPPSRDKTKCKTVNNVARTGSTDGHTTQWHRYIQMGWQAAAGAGKGEGNSRCHVHTRPSGHAPVGRSPAVSAGDNTLHTGGEGKEGGDSTDGLGRAQKTVQDGVALSWLDVCGRRGCRYYVHAWAMHGQVELESCKVAGQGRGREIRSSTARAPGGILCDAPLLRSPSSLCGRVGAGAGSPSGLAGWYTGVVCDRRF